MSSQSVRGRQAFLLVEATLTAVLITVGLVSISRGIAGSLKALARLHESERLLRLAESTLNELEAEARQFHTARHREDTYEAPNAGYRWMLSTSPIRLPSDAVTPDAFRAVTLTVSPVGQDAPLVRLHTIWPSTWVVE